MLTSKFRVSRRACKVYGKLFYAPEESILQHLQSRLGRTSKLRLPKKQCSTTTPDNPPPQGTQQQPPKPTLEEMISQNTRNSQGKIDKLTKKVDQMQKRYKVCMKNLEVQLGELSTDLANAKRTGFSGCLPWFLVNKCWFPKTVSLRDQPEDLRAYCVSV